MPLNPYNDAVGPLAKSVRDVAEVLDQVAGTDPEDPVTADAARHIDGSFAAALRSRRALTGARIGVLRQRFVGVTGEREAAALMARVAKEIEEAGATVGGCRDSRTSTSTTGAARGSAPGSLKAAWDRVSLARREAR